MLPAARRERLLAEELDGEVLVYDLDTDGAHALNPTAAAIWDACDGTLNAGDIAAQLELSLDAVETGLHRLAELNLLASPSTAANTATRRDVVKRALQAGAALGAAAPVIRSIVAPTPAQAASCFPTGTPCSIGLGNGCCSGVCQANNNFGSGTCT